MSQELYTKLKRAGWSENGAAFIATKARRDRPGFYNWLKRRLLGAKAPYTNRARKKATIPRKLRKRIYERDAYRCRRCGDWHNLSVDHIVPESKGGPTTLDNLQTLCMPCNLKKGPGDA